MKDRIEHTEHKRRDRGTPDTSTGERRYGGAAEIVEREASENPAVRP